VPEKGIENHRDRSNTGGGRGRISCRRSFLHAVYSSRERLEWIGTDDQAAWVHNFLAFGMKKVGANHFLFIRFRSYFFEGKSELREGHFRAGWIGFMSQNQTDSRCESRQSLDEFRTVSAQV
jgi:hypothetical protein